MNKAFYLVAGLGKTGLSIARYLRRRRLPFCVFDTRKNPPALTEFKQNFPDIPVYLQQCPNELIKHLKAVITSPGLPLDSDIFTKAFSQLVPVYGDIECLAKEVSATPVLAITGTNGKSTVTALVGDMVKAGGLKPAVAGNIGQPVLDVLDDGQHYDVWVLELSSFQLELTHSLKATGATVLNISADHLDRHHQLDAYIAAKQRIYSQAKTIIFNRDDENTVPRFESKMQEATPWVTYGSDEPEAYQWGLRTVSDKIWLARGDYNFLSIDALKIKGAHNWVNALAACAIAESVGISIDDMMIILKQFTGLAHRCQWVKTIEGVDWINDSKGTNIGATIAAISGIGESMQGKIILIAGGQGKGADFTELQASVAEFVRKMVLIGEDAEQMASALGETVSVLRAGSMEEAVNLARCEAGSGDVVLLSPACASLDMFKDFNHRGDVFTALVHQL